MKNNWLKTVNTINNKRYTIPDGWETKEQVAVSLQCAPDKVADMLKPGISSGDIEKSEFAVWNDKRRMTSKVTCYRIAVVGDSEVVQTKSLEPVTSSALEVKLLAALEKSPKKTDTQIAKNYRGATVEMVKKLRLRA